MDLAVKQKWKKSLVDDLRDKVKELSRKPLNEKPLKAKPDLSRDLLVQTQSFQAKLQAAEEKLQQAKEEVEQFVTLKEQRYKEMIKRHSLEIAAHEKAVAERTTELDEKVAKAVKLVDEVEQQRVKVTSGIDKGMQAADRANKNACGVRTTDQWIMT